MDGHFASKSAAGPSMGSPLIAMTSKRHGGGAALQVMPGG